jgi:hypothetical protein
MSFPVMTPFEVISLGDISISLARGHYHFATTDGRADELNFMIGVGRRIPALGLIGGVEPRSNG